MKDAVFDEFLHIYLKAYGKGGKNQLSSRAIQNEFLKRFALGFVSAHSSRSSKDTTKRIESGLTAFLGSCPSDPREKADETMLESVAERYLADRSPLNAKSSPRSLRKLAKDVAMLNPGHSADATADRLRKKFQDHKEDYLALAGDRGSDIELVIRAALHDCERIFKSFGIKFLPED